MTDPRKEEVDALAGKFREARHGYKNKWPSAEDRHLAIVALNHLAEATKYEYGIQYFDADGKWYVIGEWYGYGLLNFWTDIEDREQYLDDLLIDYPETTFMLVKRRKAGPVEHA